MKSRAATTLFALLALCGCAYQVIPLGDEPPAITPPEAPLSLTVAVREGSFDNSQLNPNGILDFFAEELREARLFEGVMYPIPPGVHATWELEIAASDSGVEPDSNFWKSFLAYALPPLSLGIYLQNDYTLELQALLLRDRHLVETYRSRATIRHRYQTNAPRAKMQAEALDLLARRATRQILAEVAADADRLARENALVR